MQKETKDHVQVNLRLQRRASGMATNWWARGLGAMGEAQESYTLPVRPNLRKAPCPREKGSRRVGFLLMMVGALLLGLAAKDAMAGAALGGDGGDVLRGSGGDENLVGFGGEDGIWGFAGSDVLSGGEGDDELYGGPDHDALFGGAGDDFVEAKDGERDDVWCGLGNDVVSVDLLDRVARDCESVYAS